MYGGHPDQVYLFILAGARTASTLLANIIRTSPSVSRSNPLGEGQGLPEFKGGRYPKWEPVEEHDWAHIKKVWMKYWDVTKPVLLEKSPPNMKYAEQIERHFQPAYFLCLVRDPYAHCEGLMRRKGLSLMDAASFALECMQIQRRNLETLERAYLLRYEDLTADPRNAACDIEVWLPQLGTLNVTGTFSSYSYGGRNVPIANLNADRIARMDEASLSAITTVFSKNADLLRYFGYSLR